MSGALANVSLRPVSMLVQFDGEAPLGMVVTYVVGVTLKKGQAGIVGGPAKTRLSFDPAEDAVLSSLMQQIADRVASRLNEQAGLVEPTVRLMDEDVVVDDEEL